MVLIANEFQKLTAAEKRRLVDLSRKKPRISTKKLIEEAKKPPVKAELVIHLDPKFMQVLDKAAKDLGMDSEDVFKTILVDSLRKLAKKGFGE